MAAVYTLPEDVVGSYSLKKLQKNSQDYSSNPIDMMKYYFECSPITFEVTCTKKDGAYAYTLKAHINNWHSVFTQTTQTNMKTALRTLDCQISETFTRQKLEGGVTKKYMKATRGFYAMAKGTSFSSNPVDFMKFYQKHVISIELTVTRSGGKNVYEMRGFEDNRDKHLVRSKGEDLTEVTKDLDRRITGAVKYSKLMHGFDLDKVSDT